MVALEKRGRGRNEIATRHLYFCSASGSERRMKKIVEQKIGPAKIDRAARGRQLHSRASQASGGSRGGSRGSQYKEGPVFIAPLSRTLFSYGRLSECFHSKVHAGRCFQLLSPPGFKKPDPLYRLLNDSQLRFAV